MCTMSYPLFCHKLPFLGATALIQQSAVAFYIRNWWHQGLVIQHWRNSGRNQVHSFASKGDEYFSFRIHMEHRYTDLTVSQHQILAKDKNSQVHCILSVRHLAKSSSMHHRKDDKEHIIANTAIGLPDKVCFHVNWNSKAFPAEKSSFHSIHPLVWYTHKRLYVVEYLAKAQTDWSLRMECTEPTKWCKLWSWCWMCYIYILPVMHCWPSCVTALTACPLGPFLWGLGQIQSWFWSCKDAD